MIEHILPTGTSGEMRIRDNSDDSDLLNVEVALRSSEIVEVSQLPWTYSIDGAMKSWKSYNFGFIVGPFSVEQPWQTLGIIFVGNANTFTFHLGNTNTIELNGPTDFTINLAGWVLPPGEGFELVNVKVDGVWKKATPYVKHDGVWKIAQTYVKAEGIWKPIV